MNYDSLFKEFVKIHYEPEHERGQTCWCRPITEVIDGIPHITHNGQRKVLTSFIQEKTIPKAGVREVLEGKRQLQSNDNALNANELIDDLLTALLGDKP